LALYADRRNKYRHIARKFHFPKNQKKIELIGSQTEDGNNSWQAKCFLILEMMTNFSPKSQKKPTLLVELAENEDLVILKVLLFQRRER